MPSHFPCKQGEMGLETSSSWATRLVRLYYPFSSHTIELMPQADDPNHPNNKPYDAFPNDPENPIDAHLLHIRTLIDPQSTSS